MTRLKCIALFCLATLFALDVLGLRAAHSQTLTWDGDPGTVGIQEATADWLSANVWFDGTNVSWTNGADAIVGTGGAGRIIRDSTPATLTLSSLTFDPAIGGGNTYHIDTNRGDRPLTFVNAAEIIVPTGVTGRIDPAPAGSATISIQGGGTINWFERNVIAAQPFTGGIAILDGTLSTQAKTNYVGQFGTLTFLDTSGSADATLLLGGNPASSWTVDNDIVVQSGSTGNALIQYSKSTGGASTGEFTGNITLDSDLTFRRTGTQTSQGLVLSGDIDGPAGLRLEPGGFPNDHFAVLSGNNTYEGTTTVIGTNASAMSLTVNGSQANSNFVLDDITMNGSGTLTFNVVDDTSDMFTLLDNAMLDLSGFTLAPLVSGTQTIEEFPITNRLTGVSGEFAAIAPQENFQFEVFYNGTAANPNAVVLQATQLAVPEPASLVAMLLAAVFAGLFWQFKR